MSSMGGSIPTFVVRVDDEVQTHELVEAGRVHAEHPTEVRRVIQRRVSLELFTIKIGVAVDARRDRGEFGNNI